MIFRGLDLDEIQTETENMNDIIIRSRKFSNAMGTIPPVREFDALTGRSKDKIYTRNGKKMCIGFIV